MAYALSERFSSPPKYYRILDPGAYQKVSSPLTHANKVPFLSKTPRASQSGNKIWTHAIYDSDKPARIVNITSLMSKLPRFPYEAMTKEEFEKILCQCGIQTTCECTSEVDEEEESVICQGKVNRRIFKGPAPRLASNLTSRVKEPKIDVPFYDARVNESTSYYQGWKWSRWTGKRTSNIQSFGPGPANYTLETEPSFAAICAEKVRAHKRKTSKQLRFIEMVQQSNLRQNLPGPGTYDPKGPKGTDLNYLGPKSERFLTRQYEVNPSPADHWIKRDFDPPDMPAKFCYAKLPAPAAFGSKAIRLIPKKEEGPSPASYDAKLYTCKYMRCTKAAFGSSSVRFKETINESSDEDVFEEEVDPQNEKEPDDKHTEPDDKHTCSLPSWEFRSKTIRMKPLLKKFNEPSPADLPQPNIHKSRSRHLQSIAPFFTSDERFRRWYNYIPVHASENTPGPCYYSLEKPKCNPAVHQGPLSRCARFKLDTFQTPSPNQYRVCRGIEDILATHNEKLKRNMDKQHKFHWKPRNEINNLNPEEKEELLLNQSIQLLNTNLTDI